MASCILIDIQLFVQTFLYFCSFIIGLIVSILVGVTVINFGGHCLLYTNLEWTDAVHFIPDFNSTSDCNYVIFVNVFACIFYGLTMTIYYAYGLCKKDPNTGAQMWVMPFVMMNALVAVITFISSCMMSVGFNDFCSDVTGGKDKGHVATSCADGETFTWHHPEIKDPRTYYSFMVTAEIASWIGALIWCMQTGLCVLRFVRNRRLRSTGMLRETAVDQTSDLEHVVDS